jgi:hypothetical protein
MGHGDAVEGRVKLDGTTRQVCGTENNRWTLPLFPLMLAGLRLPYRDKGCS